MRLIRETNPMPGKYPAVVPQHEKSDGTYVKTGENNPFPVQVAGTTLQEQQTELDEVDGKLTFSDNLEYIEIYNRDTINDGVFTVNGIRVTVPKEEAVNFRIGGAPHSTVEISGSTSYIVSRYY